MITEKAVVIAYQAGEVTVECQANQACGGCASKASCGTAALSELTGKSSRYLFTFPCSRPMSIVTVYSLSRSIYWNRKICRLMNRGDKA